MDEIHIIGGKYLEGEIAVQGSKNTVLPVMAASLLHRGTSVLKGCPRITDVFYMEEILRSLGAVTWWEDHDLYLDCTDADGSEVAEGCAGKMRSSVILLGALLGRNGKGAIGYPGGCVIGKRPVDMHLDALRALGAEIGDAHDRIRVSCRKRLCGNRICFHKVSVGATEQAILASVLAEGETWITNCAREPEIIWLCRYLRSMGADIEGEGGTCIRIRGVKELGAGVMQIPADRIVAGTYLCAAAASRGRITVSNAPEGEMDAFLEVYRKMGGQYEWKSGKLVADGSGVRFSIPFLETEVYPGFPTDLQSPLLAVLATIPDESRVRENIFENRFKICRELVRMGADVLVDGKEVRIRGGKLKGCTLEAGELRGGAALVIAALAAEGESVISGCSYIRRGYENICADLRSLGGFITEDTGTGNL